MAATGKRVPPTEWNIEASAKAQRTKNPIRRIVDRISATGSQCGKEMIPLSIGDPTVYGNLAAPDELTEAVMSQVKSKSKKANGYAHSTGIAEVRAAVAGFMSHEGAQLTADDVMLASGGSGALELAIAGIVNEGDNILVPRPGFPLYEVIAQSNGASVKQYPLLPEKAWSVDIEGLEAEIDDNTKAIILNNPSNPCGSLLSDENLVEILQVAERHRLPIIADEIYGEMVFSGSKFTPIAALSRNVPVISISGMAKMFLVPGWRVGWLCIHDRNNVLAEYRQGLLNLTQLILGSNTLVQAALADVLTNETTVASLKEFNTEYVKTLQNAAEFSTEKLRQAPGLTVIEPKGAMYMMVGIQPQSFDESIKDEQDFAALLLQEEAVFVLPGSCFYLPNFFRIVLSAPLAKLEEAYGRIIAFCQRHAAK